MTVRVTEAQVREIIETNVSLNLAPFIKAASLIVDRVVDCATRKSITLSADEQLEVERWLAAHFYAHRDQQYTSKSTGSASGSFQGQTGMHLESTLYGQTSMDLDPSGCLRAINKGGRVSMKWLGKNPSDQTNYVDRR